MFRKIFSLLSLVLILSACSASVEKLDLNKEFKSKRLKKNQSYLCLGVYGQISDFSQWLKLSRLACAKLRTHFYKENLGFVYPFEVSLDELKKNNILKIKKIKKKQETAEIISVLDPKTSQFLSNVFSKYYNKPTEVSSINLDINKLFSDYKNLNFEPYKYSVFFVIDSKEEKYAEYEPFEVGIFPSLANVINSIMFSEKALQLPNERNVYVTLIIYDNQMKKLKDVISYKINRRMSIFSKEDFNNIFLDSIDLFFQRNPIQNMDVEKLNKD